MRTVEIAGVGNASVADRLAEVNAWLLQAGIAARCLEPLSILKARARFRAAFERGEDAERFRQYLDEAPMDGAA